MGINDLKEYFPVWYEEWLFQALSIKKGDETKDDFLKPLFNLNKNWLKENYDKKETSWDDLHVAKAYAVYYMSINIPKLWMVLDNSTKWTPEGITTVTDYGCGPGTFLWSYLFYLRKRFPEQLQKMTTVKGVDSSPANLEIAQSLFEDLKKIKEFKHLTAEFSEGKWQDHYEQDSSDLKIFGNALVESTESMDLILETPFKNMLIIEPGTSKHFQRMRKVRDVFADKHVAIHFPCTAQSNSCPLSSDNWCHFHVNRFILPFIQRMSNIAGRKNHRHHFCSFLFSNTTPSITKGQWRLLSNTRKAKGTAIRYICNGQNVIEAVLNKKQKSDQNQDFIKAESGSVCFCPNDIANSKLTASHSFQKI